MSESLLRETLNAIKTAGFSPAVTNGARHLHIHWIDHAGCHHRIAISHGRAPKGVRHERNLRAQLKRKLNGAAP
jgi:hypothetical protein